MKLSISNIGWTSENDEYMYNYLKKVGFEGIEIAPTRIFKINPYNKIREAREYSKEIKKKYSLDISSMQSIWFGRNEGIFNSKEEREILLDYTKKAIDFASEIKCNNIVFGCPKNRKINKENKDHTKISREFFEELGSYAEEKNTVIAIEPNPVIYDTNFINTTEEAFEFVRSLNNTGVKVNVDLGTIINNNEQLSILAENIDLINHVHISEPYLEEIEKRDIHFNLARILKENNYQKYISIEMKNLNSLDTVTECVEYIREVFR